MLHRGCTFTYYEHRCIIESASSGGGLPAGLDGMMNNPAMKEAMAKVGGADGLADLMKNPQMMAMAQKMMKDPKVLPYSHLFA